MYRNMTYFHLICVNILSCPSVEDVGIFLVFGAELGSQSPHSILKSWRWFPQGSAVEGLPEPHGVDDGKMSMLSGEEGGVPV